MKFNREILLDDYFKFLFDEKIYNVHYFMLDDYIHIGSINEYLELKYWENYLTWWAGTKTELWFVSAELRANAQ